MDVTPGLPALPRSPTLPGRGVGDAEFESISTAILNGAAIADILQLVVTQATAILDVERAYIFLQDDATRHLYLKASTDPPPGDPPISAAPESLETWVYQRGRPLALPTPRRERSRPATGRDPAAVRRSTQLHPHEDATTISQAAVPIWRSATPVGVLVVIDSRLSAQASVTPVASPPSPDAGDAFPPAPSTGAPLPDVLPFLGVFADLVSLALENQHILKRQQRRSQLIALLRFISQTSFNQSQPSLPELATTLADQITAATGAEKVDIMLHSPQTDELVTLGTSTTALSQLQVQLGLDHVPLATAGQLAQVYRSGQPFLSGELLPTDLLDPADKLGIHSCVIIPLVVDHSPTGVISLSSTQPHFFDDDDVNFMSFVSVRLGYLLRDGQLTAELAQAENARIVADERENFIAVVAHDLKNALAVVRGNGELNLRRMRRGDFSFSERAQQLALTKANQALRLVDDMVAVSQIERGSFRLFRTDIELVSLVLEEIDAVETTHAERTFSVQTDYKEVIVNADAVRIRQVVSNLLNNAVRYSPATSPIAIRIAAAATVGDVAEALAAAGRATESESVLPPTEGRVVQVTVADQGMGIAFADQPHIFDRFYRGRGAEVASGSGLGLYISREIVLQHGGQLWVTSEEGVGSQFHFQCPAISVDPLNLSPVLTGAHRAAGGYIFSVAGRWDARCVRRGCTWQT